MVKPTQPFPARKYPPPGSLPGTYVWVTHHGAPFRCNVAWRLRGNTWCPTIITEGEDYIALTWQHKNVDDNTNPLRACYICAAYVELMGSPLNAEKEDHGPPV